MDQANFIHFDQIWYQGVLVGFEKGLCSFYWPIHRMKSKINSWCLYQARKVNGHVFVCQLYRFCLLDYAHMRNVWFTSYDHAYHVSLHMPIKWLFSCEKCRIYIFCPLLQWLSSHEKCRIDLHLLIMSIWLSSHEIFRINISCPASIDCPQIDFPCVLFILVIYVHTR